MTLLNGSFAVHSPLPTTTAWVDNRVFYNMNLPESVKPEFVKVKIFGLTCLTGNVPTFEIITEDGYVFSEIPPHLIFWKNNPSPETHLPLSLLVYNNCLSENFNISQFPELQQNHAFIFYKGFGNDGKYFQGQYWFSLDFYQNNNWFHCLKLDNGQFTFIPSHKIVFSKCDKMDINHKFPQFQKLRQSFKV